MINKISLPLLIINIILLNSPAVAKTAKDSLDVTIKNLKGHESLFNEGWFIVTSSKEALNLAHENQIQAAQAMRQVLNDLKNNNKDLSTEFGNLKKQTDNDADQFNKNGNENTKNIFTSTSKLTNEQWSQSKINLQKAYSSITLGYIELHKRTADDWAALKMVNAELSKNIQHPLSDPELKIIMDDIYDDAKNKSNIGIWSSAFTLANEDIKTSYNESGQESNSLAGTWTLIKGYFLSLYDGVISPSGKTVTEGAKKAGPFLLGNIIVGLKISGDVVYTIGLNLFYTTKIGYKIISPTVEGGFLASLAVVSAASVPIIYAGGTGLGTVNQIAVTAATPAVGTGQFMLASTAETAKYSALVTYNLISGTGKALINESKAAMVLGYNMLTALPAHALLGAANSIVFITYDGPKLVIAYASGEIDGVPLNHLPVGTVLNQKELEKRNIKVKTLTTDEKTIQQVLEAAPKDLRK